jgi:hypothetical protein
MFIREGEVNTPWNVFHEFSRFSLHDSGVFPRKMPQQISGQSLFEISIAADDG